MAIQSSRVRRLLKIAGLAAAFVVVFFIVVTAWINHRGTVAQRDVFASLEAHGMWPPKNSTAPSEGSQAFRAAADLLEDLSFDPQNSPIPGEDESHFGVRIPPELKESLEAFIKTHAEFHEHILAGIKNAPANDYVMTSTIDQDVWSQYASIRRAARAMNTWNLYEQAGNNPDAAMDAMADVVRLRIAWCDEPFFITMLIGLSIDSFVYAETQNALSRGEPSTEALERLFAEISRINHVNLFIDTFRGEALYHARALAAMDDIIESQAQAISSMRYSTYSIPDYGTKSLREYPISSGLPKWAQIDTASNYKIDAQMMRIGHAVWPGIRKFYMSKWAKSHLDFYDGLTKISPSPKDFWPGVGLLSKKYKLSVTIQTPHSASLMGFAAQRVVSAALRVEQYRIAHGQWPATLADANASFDDPLSKNTLLYKRLSDGVVVYSIGRNGVDDGGEQEDFSIISADIAFRLLDPKVRGTLTKPAPSVEGGKQ